MKAFKYVIWIILLFIFQTVVMNYIAPFGYRADLILPFVVIVAIKEDSFKVSTIVSIACAVMTGTVCGKNFSFCVLFYTYVGAIVFTSRKYWTYIPDSLKFIIWVLPASIVSELISYLLLYSSVKWLHGAFIHHMIPAAVFTMVGAAVIYFIANVTLFRKRRFRGRLINS